MDIPLNINISGEHRVSVSAWGLQAGEELTKLGVSVKSDAISGQSNGARQIKSQIVELYDRFHGIEMDSNHSDVIDTYELIVDSWTDRKAINTDQIAPWPEEGCHFDNWQISRNYDNERDPTGMKYAWMTTLIMMMSDFNYLHE